MDEKTGALEEENRRLRGEIDRMKQDKPKGSSKMTCWIVLLVCALLAIPVLAVLAAIALPAYSTFKQKATVGKALKSVLGCGQVLADWHDAHETFENLTAPSEGGAITADGEPVGVDLAVIPDMVWGLEAAQDCLKIKFHWLKGCPTHICDGYYEICCSDTDCTQIIRVGENNALGFDYGP